MANHFEINSLVIFGFIIFIGVIGGQIARISRYFPKVTGYIIIGLLFGPNVFGVISHSVLNDARIFTDIAVGLILFQLGLEFNLRSLYRERSLFIMGLTESLVTFALITATLTALKVNIMIAALAASIGVSSSPALTLHLAANDSKQGLVTKQSLTLATINNIFAFGCFMLLLPLVNLTLNDDHQGVYSVIVDPIYRIFGPVILAIFFGYIMLKVAKLIGKRESAQFSLFVAILTMSIGTAKVLHLSPVVTPLILGIFVANFDRYNDLLKIEADQGAELFFIILFVVTGAKLHIAELINAGWIATGFVVARIIGKFIPVFTISRKDGMTVTHSYALGLTLLPMAGMAIGLINTVSDTSTIISNALSSIILPAIAIIEMKAPLITTFALRKTGELSTSLRHCQREDSDYATTPR